MDRILVTGGTGYIGSHTVVELQQAGYPVVIIDDLSNSNREVIDGIERITGIVRILLKETARICRHSPDSLPIIRI